jgi:hypothetical protein
MWNVPCAVQCLALVMGGGGGEADIVDHVSTKKHKAAVSAKSSRQNFLDKKTWVTKKES